MKREVKYELNNENKYDIMLRGFDYSTFTCRSNWTKIREVETEDEAKLVCANCVDFGD